MHHLFNHIYIYTHVLRIPPGWCAQMSMLWQTNKQTKKPQQSRTYLRHNNTNHQSHYLQTKHLHKFLPQLATLGIPDVSWSWRDEEVKGMADIKIFSALAEVTVEKISSVQGKGEELQSCWEQPGKDKEKNQIAVRVFWGISCYQSWVNQGWGAAEKRLKFTLLLLSVLFNLVPFPIPPQPLPASPNAPSQTYSALGFQQPFPPLV